jgi:hypothetical protein
VEFIKVKSYENTESTGNVKISLSEEELEGFKGKVLLIFTGSTYCRRYCRHGTYNGGLDQSFKKIQSIKYQGGVSTIEENLSQQ